MYCNHNIMLGLGGIFNHLSGVLILDIVLSGAEFTAGNNNAQLSDLSKIMKVEQRTEYVMLGFQIGSTMVLHYFSQTKLSLLPSRGFEVHQDRVVAQQLNSEKSDFGNIRTMCDVTKYVT
ncbi:hypothetical protein C8R44DRAFT_738227 [Mycena epipterygia]|nr:hypothetical protein C8R44DRAFT_738227 [Mycena epipterygia]